MPDRQLHSTWHSLGEGNRKVKGTAPGHVMCYGLVLPPSLAVLSGIEVTVRHTQKGLNKGIYCKEIAL